MGTTWQDRLRGSTWMAKEVARLRTTTDAELLLKKSKRNWISQARRHEMNSRASCGMSGSTSIIKECHGLKHSGAATPLLKLRTTTARTLFCVRDSDNIDGERGSNPSIDRPGSNKAVPSRVRALTVHHSGSSALENPAGKNVSKVAFFSILPNIQRSSFIKYVFKMPNSRNVAFRISARLAQPAKQSTDCHRERTRLLMPTWGLTSDYSQFFIFSTV